MRLKYVVLPAPLGPTMAVSVPGAKALGHTIDRHMAAKADGQVVGCKAWGSRWMRGKRQANTNNQVKTAPALIHKSASSYQK